MGPVKSPSPPCRKPSASVGPKAELSSSVRMARYDPAGSGRLKFASQQKPVAGAGTPQLAVAGEAANNSRPEPSNRVTMGAKPPGAIKLPAPLVPPAKENVWKPTVN